MEDTKTAPQNIAIRANTQIVFTVGKFLTLIGTLLGLFFGFYMLVVVPRVDKMEKHYETIFTDQKAQNRVFYLKFDEMVKSIGLNTTAIQATNARFRDLNNSLEEIANSGGSFGETASATNNSTDPYLSDIPD